MKRFYNCIMIAMFFFISVSSKYSVNAQNEKGFSSKIIQQLIDVDSLDKADFELNKQIEHLIAQKKYNDLAEYVYIIGKIQLLKNEEENAKSESRKIAALIQKKSKDANTLYQININLSKLFFELNNVQKAYDYALEAKTHASKSKAIENILNSEYYLGDYGMKLGNIELLELHIRKAVQIINAAPKTQYKISARVYNLMGATMYFSSKQDSAIYYFETAIDNVKYLEKNYENQLYLPAAIKGNLFLMYLNQGKHNQAKKLVEESLTLSRTF